jgi:hypothetical protein
VHLGFLKEGAKGCAANHNFPNEMDRHFYKNNYIMRQKELQPYSGFRCTPCNTFPSIMLYDKVAGTQFPASRKSTQKTQALYFYG